MADGQNANGFLSLDDSVVDDVLTDGHDARFKSGALCQLKNSVATGELRQSHTGVPKFVYGIYRPLRRTIRNVFENRVEIFKGSRRNDYLI